MTDGFNAVVAVPGGGRAREDLAQSLEGMGFRVREAASGERVLQLASERAGLVVLGGRMPDMDPVEVVRRLKAGPATASIPVVLIRAVDEPGGSADGADGVLRGAPPVPEDLLAGSVRLAVLGEAPAGDEAGADAWQSALDRLGDGICILDPEGRVVRCNRTLPTLLGRTDGALLGRDLAGSIEEGRAPGGGSLIRRAMATRRRQSDEWERDGRWLRITVDPLPESLGSIAVVSDVTEARRLRERIADAEAARLEGEARIAQLERDARVLRQFADPALSQERVGPDVLLRTSDPDLFCDLIAEYDDLLGLMLEQRSYRVEHQAEITRRLREVAGRMGGGRSGPRDVIEVHGTALRRRAAESNSKRARAVAEEGRLLVLELMGHLASYYRTLATPARRGPPADGRTTPDDGRKATG